MQGEGEAVEIREFQTWLENWDRERGWDRVLVVHTLAHAMEELGEVARAVLRCDSYKPSVSNAATHAELKEELGDLFVFLFKLAYQCDIDVEEALCAVQTKADNRYPDLAAAEEEVEHYLTQQEETLQRLRENSPADES